MGVGQDFVYMLIRRYTMFGRMHTRSKESEVVPHSLNYTESYEIYVGTCGIFSCSKVCYM